MGEKKKKEKKAGTCRLLPVVWREPCKQTQEQRGSALAKGERCPYPVLCQQEPQEGLHQGFPSHPPVLPVWRCPVLVCTWERDPQG